MSCKRCERPLTGRQESYCSQVCSKLHLKVGYRKRHRADIREYNRAYRNNVRREPSIRGRVQKFRYLKGKECRICGSTTNLTLNHIIPLSAGGQTVASNLETLCGGCNTREYVRIVRKALKLYFEAQSPPPPSHFPTAKT